MRIIIDLIGMIKTEKKINTIFLLKNTVFGENKNAKFTL